VTFLSETVVRTGDDVQHLLLALAFQGTKDFPLFLSRARQEIRTSQAIRTLYDLLSIFKAKQTADGWIFRISSPAQKRLRRCSGL
jgi:hypothetical protein